MVFSDPAQGLLASFFSLLLAVIFWLLASGDGSFRGMERIVTVEVAIHNLPMDQVVVDSPPAPIKVRIAGLSPFLKPKRGGGHQCSR